jgi:hypothetical protein
MRRHVAPSLPAVALALVAGTAGCRASGTPAAAPVPPPSVQVTTSSPVTSPPTPAAKRHRKPRPTPTPHPVAAAYHWHTSPVTTASLGRSWRPGCPVGASGLRAILLTYWGFDGKAHEGTLVVATTAVRVVAAAFRRIYAAHFPIRQMQPVAAYGGNDNRSMAHDNTSAFNCRYAVANGPKHWSEHAFGNAVDIDPLENPYRLDGKILPPAGAPFMNRADVRPGMVVPGSAPVDAFDTLGWGWGGRWAGTPDYQHFSATGN